MEQRTILMTGATGALGSVLLPRLLAAGHRVICLVRPSANRSAQERIRNLVGNMHGVRVVEGDVTLEHCGIGDDSLPLLRTASCILHGAASVAFMDADAAQAINIGGMHNVLMLADRLGITDIRMVSTAYVAGDAERFNEGDLFVRQTWRNPYEASKAFAEKLLREWADRNPARRCSVFRPSILIGCDDGTTPTFEGYFAFFRPIHLAAQAMRARAAHDERTVPPDVRVADGWVHMPLVIHSSFNSTLNLVPTDWVATCISTLLLMPNEGKSYHLVHHSPPPVWWVIMASLAALRVSGATIVTSPEEMRERTANHLPLMAKLQAQISRTLSLFVPYVTREPSFGRFNVNDRDELPRVPMIDGAYLLPQLEYAVRRNWGAKE